MSDFKLPDLGEGVAEAELERWLVAEGDVVAEDDPLVEVMTDKVSVEIPSPYAGVIARIHVQAGEVAPVGATLVSIESPEVGSPKAATVDAAGSAPQGSPSEARAMPPVRKLAQDLGVELGALAGSGPGGRIVRADVERRSSVQRHPAGGRGEETSTPRGSGSSFSGTSKGEAGRREPLRGVRRAVAQRMAEAHRTVPPVTHVEECDVTELDATRRLYNERGNGSRLTFLPFIIKAVTAGLGRHPALNASLDEAAQEIVYHDRCHIGIAVDTPEGLVVPVVRDADSKSLQEIADDIERLGAGARASALEAEDLRGSTFTVTSPGAFGGLMATPIVFYPQAAILGVHKASDRPVVRDDNIVIRKMMNLSITFDHRILDGMTAARFMLDVVELLEHPALLTLES